MSTVRINDDIKKEIMPILDDLGLSLIVIQSKFVENVIK